MDLHPHTIIHPLRPRADAGWEQLPSPPQWVTLGYAGLAFHHPATGLNVISAVEVAHDPGQPSKGPEYHLSVSRCLPFGVVRCSSQEAKQVLADFGLEGAEEDNHVPSGKVRNFWRPVAEHLVGLECPCKADEPAIVEDKGDYTWRGVPNG